MLTPKTVILGWSHATFFYTRSYIHRCHWCTQRMFPCEASKHSKRNKTPPKCGHHQWDWVSAINFTSITPSTTHICKLLHAVAYGPKNTSDHEKNAVKQLLLLCGVTMLMTSMPIASWSCLNMVLSLFCLSALPVADLMVIEKKNLKEKPMHGHMEIQYTY